MGDDQFDAIVVGAGLAGLSCAAELVLHGQRPLLISETKEVGATFAVTEVGGPKNLGFLQHMVWNIGWGGGWWYPLARALNIPLRFYPSMPLAATVRGTGRVVDIPYCTSAAALTDTLLEALPIPGLDALRGPFEKVMQAALAIPYQELVKMDRVPLAEWLPDQGADEMISAMVLSFCGNLQELKMADAIEHLSVFGGLSGPRAYLCNEANVVTAVPDIRNGLCIPLAGAIEQRGGTVWRGRRVLKVLVEGDKARGVVLVDGTEMRAPVVAIACGNSRIAGILDPLPDEVQAPLAYSEQTASQDFCTYAVLDKPVVPREHDRFLGVINPEDGSNVQWAWPLHAAAPWTCEPGMQMLASQSFYSAKEVAGAGGEEAIYAEMAKVNEEIYPGYQEATVAFATQRHRHHWMTPLMVGPKLSRTIDSVRDLWFVGDGSTPVGGAFMEAAASAGILGARGILAAQSRNHTSS